MGQGCPQKLPLVSHEAEVSRGRQGLCRELGGQCWGCAQADSVVAPGGFPSPDLENTTQAQQTSNRQTSGATPAHEVLHHTLLMQIGIIVLNGWGRIEVDDALGEWAAAASTHRALLPLGQGSSVHTLTASAWEVSKARPSLENLTVLSALPCSGGMCGACKEEGRRSTVLPGSLMLMSRLRHDQQVHAVQITEGAAAPTARQPAPGGLSPRARMMSQFRWSPGPRACTYGPQSL